MPDILIAASPGAGRYDERRGGQIELHQHRCAFTRVHANGLFPTEFVRFRSTGRSLEVGKRAIAADLERLARKHLDVHQVEMDGMSISGRIKNPPDLGGAGLRVLGRRIHVIAAECLGVERYVGSEPLDEPQIGIEIFVKREVTNRHAWRRSENADRSE